MRQVDIRDGVGRAEFDLAYSKINESAWKKAWLDLILESPEMNRLSIWDMSCCALRGPISEEGPRHGGRDADPGAPAGRALRGALFRPAAPEIEAVHAARWSPAPRWPSSGAAGPLARGARPAATLIGEGVHVVTLRAVASGAVLDRITLMPVPPLDEDIRADLALLRDELKCPSAPSAATASRPAPAEPPW